MSAIISPCGQYRYALTRAAECRRPTKRAALFVMLNPSTADAEKDDPTIRRCRAFAKLWGCDGLTVANLYALRATDPKALWAHSDPVGIDNDRHLALLVESHSEIVCAWGTNAREDRIAVAVERMQQAGARLMCLGMTKSGAPRHPLYVAGNQPLIEWRAT
jgi:hypothetical protein